MVVDFLTPTKLIVVVKYVSCMQALWLVISSDHLSSKLHSRVKSKILFLIIKWFTDLVSSTTGIASDTSSKDIPAYRRSPLHLFPFGHLDSVLYRCDSQMSLHFSPLQQKENTPFSSKIHCGLVLWNETECSVHVHITSFFFNILVIQASHLEMHQALQKLDLFFLQNNVGRGCIYWVLQYILLLYHGSAARHYTADRSFWALAQMQHQVEPAKEIK